MPTPATMGRNQGRPTEAGIGLARHRGRFHLVVEFAQAHELAGFDMAMYAAMQIERM